LSKGWESIEVVDEGEEVVMEALIGGFMLNT
jgi:hypothetical protein